MDFQNKVPLSNTCTRLALLISIYSFTQALHNAATPEERVQQRAASNSPRKQADSAHKVTGQQVQQPSAAVDSTAKLAYAKGPEIWAGHCYWRTRVCEGSYWQPGSLISFYTYHFFHPFLLLFPLCCCSSSPSYDFGRGIQTEFFNELSIWLHK